MGKIIWTYEAERWLKSNYDYIAKEDEPQAAEVAAGIYEKVQVLKQHPQIGYKYRAEPEGQIRILLYGHYRIAYLLLESHDVKVLGIFHGALDLNRYTF